MTSRGPAQTRPPAAPNVHGGSAVSAPRIPPRPQPVRSLSAAHLSLGTGVGEAQGGNNGTGGSAGPESGSARGPESSSQPASSDAAAGASGVANTSDPAAIKTPGRTPVGTPGPSDGPAAASKLRRDRRRLAKLRYVDGTRNTNTHSDSETREGVGRDESGPMLPFPSRPGAPLRAKTAQLQQAMQAVRLGQARKSKPSSSCITVDVPLEARKFPNGRAADFDPWTGHRPEDHLTEKLIKGGFMSTPLVSIQDSNTARPLVWSNLKNKSGLQTLSNLFVSVLERRQQSGKIAGPNSFKPPPRVALTDKSRETWLQELANPNVPLRRLSRRIPHGIRGKGLLEECLIKGIPTSRAVWLVKCVGANEMRAFKRKGATGSSSAATGMGGEGKWVKEWTGQIQQFLESVILACGQPGWKAKIQYAIKLVTYLYSEHLLDKDQYLDWILSSLQASSTDRLPLWLLMMQIYWKDLTSSRWRGKHLCEALLSHIQAIVAADDEEICAPLLQQIKESLAVIAVKHRACLILPETWPQYKDTIQQLAKWKDSPVLNSAINSIFRRNNALSPLETKEKTDGGSPRRTLLRALDGYVQSVSHAHDVEDLSSSCLVCGLSEEDTMITALRWATTKYRAGKCRVYLVTRLLRKWKTAGLDTDSAVLAFLDHSQTHFAVDEDAAFKIIAELCRSRHFSTGRYLQWLIASGSLSGFSGSTSMVESHKRLLAELPVAGLPDHIIHLRTTLLKGFEASSAADGTDTASIKSSIKSMVLSLPSNYDDVEKLELAAQSLSVRYELSQWLRSEVASMCQTILAPPKTHDDKPAEVRVSVINQDQLCLVRSLLEQLDDMAILADVLGICTTSRDPTVLAAVADTVHLHAKTFGAIGALHPLFKLLSERYHQLRAAQPLDRPFVFALYDLATALTVDQRQLLQLKLDLSTCEQRAAVAMCSPASDSMGEIALSVKANLSVEDEIEKILNSGTNLDEPAMGRVFSRVLNLMTDQVSKQNTGSSDDTAPSWQSFPYEVWFQKLRAFDERVFERLMNDWVTGLLLEQAPDPSPRGIMSFAIPTVIGAGVADLERSVKNAGAMLEQLLKIDPGRTGGAALNILRAMAPGGLQVHTLVEPGHRYRFHIERAKLEATMMSKLASLLEIVTRSKDEATVHQATQVAHNPELLACLTCDAVHNVQRSAETLDLDRKSGRGDALDSLVESILNKLLHPEGDRNYQSLTKTAKIRHTINDANDFTIPLCQLQIRHLLSSPDDSVMEDADDDTHQESTEAALLDAVKAAIARDDSAWAELLPGVGDEVISRVREFAEEHVLAAADTFVANVKAEEKDGAWPASDMAAVRRYIDVVDLTTRANPAEASQGQQFPAVIARVKSFNEVLAYRFDKHVPADRASLELISQWADVLLHMSILQRAGFGQASANEQVGYAVALSALLVQPYLQHVASTTERAFDALTIVADAISPELRAQVSKCERCSDPRVAFLFGTTAEPEAWLGLVTSFTGVANVPTSTPKSTAGTAASPASPSPATPQHHARRLSQPQTPTQQQLPQAQALQRQASQQRIPPGQTRGPPPQGSNALPPKPGALPTGRGMPPQPGQTQQQQFQARQAQQAWPPAQQNRPQQSQTPHLTTIGSSASAAQPGNVGMQQQTAASSATPMATAALPLQKPQFNPPVPFPLRRWEILPDASAAVPGPAGATGSATVAKGESNDTAISLALFGARKVV